jgi:hypothetical protein
MWVAHTNGVGYGMITRGRATEGKALAHRVSYELHFGPIPEGMEVMHLCDTPGCVRPDHLALGAHRDNMLDAHRKNRHPAQTAHPRNAEWRKNVGLGHRKFDPATEGRIKALHQSGVSMRALSRQFSIDRTSIKRIVSS